MEIIINNNFNKMITKECCDSSFYLSFYQKQWKCKTPEKFDDEIK
jgi:hypothetical protein